MIQEEMSFRRIVDESSQQQDEDSSSLLLVCAEGLLQCPPVTPIAFLTRNRRIYKKRCFVLLKACPFGLVSLLPPATSTNDYGVENRPPVLLFYETSSSRQPSLVLPLWSRQQQRQLGVEEPSNLSISVSEVEGHPKHIQLEMSRPSSGISFATGTDTDMLLPQTKPPSAGSTRAGWRLKFPNPEVAQLWRDTLQSLLTMTLPYSSPSRIPTEREASRRPSSFLSDLASRFVGRQTSSRLPPARHQTPDTRRMDQHQWLSRGRRGAAQQQLPTSSAAWKHIFGIILLTSVGFVLLGLVSFSFVMYSLWRLTFRGRQETHAFTGASSMSTPLPEQGFPPDCPEFKMKSNPPQDVLASVSAVQQEIMTQAVATIRIWCRSLWGVVQDALKSPHMLQNEKLPMQDTPLRSICGCFGTLSFFTPKSFVSQYLWLILPAVLVLLVSSASITCRMFPGLAPTLSRNKFWILAPIPLLVGFLLGQDTYLNYIQHPLRYGLYWQAYIRTLGIVICILVGKILIDKARGRRPRIRISNRRKTTAGLSAFLSSLSAPLILRGMQERDYAAHGNDDHRWLVFVGVAFLLFNVGMYFFGWATRHSLVISGHPVGEHIYQLSLFPSQCINHFLYLAGDLTRYVVIQLLLPAITSIPERLDCFGEAVLSLVEGVGRVLAEISGSVLISRRLQFLKQCLIATRILVCKAIPLLQSKMAKLMKTMRTRVLTSPLVQALKRAFIMTCRALCDGAQRTVRDLRSRYQALQPLCVRLLRASLSRLQTIMNISAKISVAVMERALVYSRATLHQLEVTTNTFAKHCLTIHRSFVACMERIILPIRRVWNDSLFSCLRFLSFVVKSVTQNFRGGLQVLGRVLGRYLTDLLRLLATFNRHLAEMTNAVCLSIYNKVIEPAAVFGHRGLFILFNNAQFVVAHVIFPWLVSALLALRNIVVIVLGGFLNKYWQLVPAGLALNGSILYAGAAISVQSLSGWSFSVTQFALGSWSLFLIGCTIMHGVLSSQDHLVTQHVIIQESILQYIDLYAISAATRMLVSGWHLLSMVLVLFLKTCDFVIRRASTYAWRLLVWACDYFWKPLYRMTQKLVHSIWASPYVSLFTSLGVIVAVYAHHSSGFAAYISTHGVLLLNGSLVRAVIDNFRAFVGCLSHLALSPVRSIGNFCRLVYEPIVQPNVGVSSTSPSVAMLSWVYTCIIVKTRIQVRRKTLAIPVVVFYVTSVAYAALLRASFVTLVFWVLLSLFVDKHEQQEAAQIQRALETHQLQRRRHRQERNAAPRVNTTASLRIADQGVEKLRWSPTTATTTRFEQGHCCICLDSFSAHKNSKEFSHLSTLPCGHTFHRSCVEDWLAQPSSHQRCPVCRRATRGQGLLLEVLF